MSDASGDHIISGVPLHVPNSDRQTFHPICVPDMHDMNGAKVEKAKKPGKTDVEPGEGFATRHNTYSHGKESIKKGTRCCARTTTNIFDRGGGSSYEHQVLDTRMWSVS